MAKRHVRIEYRVRPEVQLDALARQIAQFVSGIHAHDAAHEYTSYQDAKDPRHFVHVGTFDEAALPGLQAEPFFQEFTAMLRASCAVPPDVTMLAPVASTR